MVFKSRARRLQEAEVQRFQQWDNQEWSRERDVTQRQVLQVIVSAQGAARRDRRFQAEHAEHGKIRTQCKGCSVIASQERQGDDEKMIARHSVAVVLLLLLRWLLRLLSLRFGPMWLAAPAPLAPPPSSCSPPSLSPLSPLKTTILLPATIWHPSDIPRSTEHTCLHNFFFIRTLIWCSHLI